MRVHKFNMLVRVCLFVKPFMTVNEHVWFLYEIKYSICRIASAKAVEVGLSDR